MKYWSSMQTLSDAAGGGPETIVVLMEGEALFNDASSIVLFEFFFDMLKKQTAEGRSSDNTLWEQIMEVAVDISWLTVGELLINGQLASKVVLNAP